MFELHEPEFTLNEACEMLNTQTHNIRCWENELGIKVKRNELNQRTYTKDNIDKFRLVIQLKKEGINQKIIKKILLSTEVLKQTMQETAASKDLTVIDNKYFPIVNELKEQLLMEINIDINNIFDIREQNFQKLIDKLNNRIDHLEQERTRKTDELIFEWRKKSKQKSFLNRLLHK